MTFYCPGRHQAATQIGAYFALLETIKRYQNEEIEPLGGGRRSRRVALQVLGMFSAWGAKCGSVVSHFDPRLKVHFYNKKAPKTEVFDAFCLVLTEKMQHQKRASTL